MKYKVVKAFDWAHKGVDFQAYALDEEIDHAEVEDALIEVGLAEGWIEEVGGSGNSPENKGQLSPAEKGKITRATKQLQEAQLQMANATTDADKKAAEELVNESQEKLDALNK